MRAVIVSMIFLASLGAAAAEESRQFEVQKPKGTWQQPGPIQQPKGTWQQPAAVEQPKAAMQQPGPIEAPKGTWQQPGPIQQPKATWQQPGPIQERTWQQPGPIQEPKATWQQPGPVEPPVGTWQDPGPIEQPSGTWQRVGPIRQPTGTWQEPGPIQQPKGPWLVTEAQCERRFSVVGDALFDFDRANLRPDAEETLSAAGPEIARLADRPAVIEGHTDALGGDAYNLKLSEARAKTARDWLATHGFLPNSTPIRGYGKTKPVAPNQTDDGRDDPEGRQKNRRVEIVFATCG